jgi:hypothetical protein
MLRFSGVVKLSHRVRSGVDLFASNHTGHYHYQEGNPDHDTANFNMPHLANQMPLRLVVGSRVRVRNFGTFGALCACAGLRLGRF